MLSAEALTIACPLMTGLDRHRGDLTFTLLCLGVFTVCQ